MSADSGWLDLDSEPIDQKPELERKRELLVEVRDGNRVIVALIIDDKNNLDHENAPFYNLDNLKDLLFCLRTTESALEVVEDLVVSEEVRSVIRKLNEVLLLFFLQVGSSLKHNSCL